jgi:hypothetical protein
MHERQLRRLRRAKPHCSQIDHATVKGLAPKIARWRCNRRKPDIVVEPQTASAVQHYSMDRRTSMVPGITERERLAADVRRLEWLAEARLRPPLVVHSSHRSRGKKPSRPSLSPSLGLPRHGLALALLLMRRVRLLEPRMAGAGASTIKVSGR